MPPIVRSLLLVSLLTAAAWASSGAPESSTNDPKPVDRRDDAKAADSRKSDVKPAEPSEHPAASTDAPSANNAATPAREAAKPTPPAGKQRPAWPPPSELIS